MIIRTNYGIREANGCPHELLDPEVGLRRPSRYCCSVMYAAVSDMSYIAEHVVLGEGKWLGGKPVGLKYLTHTIDTAILYALSQHHDHDTRVPETLLWKRHRRNAIVVMSAAERHSSGSLPKAGCLPLLGYSTPQCNLHRINPL